MQLELIFSKSDVSADYLFVDLLAEAIDRVSADVQERYGPILAGDNTIWKRITAALHAPKQKAQLP